VPVSPSQCEEGSRHKTIEFASGLLLGNPRHGFGLPLGEARLDVVGRTAADEEICELIHQII
jgi:hypothetical protein